jgi:hypothetical protein
VKSKSTANRVTARSNSSLATSSRSRFLLTFEPTFFVADSDTLLLCPVAQFDSHDESSTVREAIEFSAQLRLPSDLDPHEKAARVESVLDSLGLRQFEHTIIGAPDRGGVNPEVRKKLTIAVELVRRVALWWL